MRVLGGGKTHMMVAWPRWPVQAIVLTIRIRLGSLRLRSDEVLSNSRKGNALL